MWHCAVSGAVELVGKKVWSLEEKNSGHVRGRSYQSSYPRIPYINLVIGSLHSSLLMGARVYDASTHHSLCHHSFFPPFPPCAGRHQPFLLTFHPRLEAFPYVHPPSLLSQLISPPQWLSTTQIRRLLTSHASMDRQAYLSQPSTMTIAIVRTGATNLVPLHVLPRRFTVPTRVISRDQF